MSTRTNIIIEVGETKVYLYRHHDGYPAGAGADLARKLIAAGNNVDRFLESLLTERYEQQSYQTKPSPVYEITDSIHGDIEYLYRVSFKIGEGKPEIGYRAFSPGSDRGINHTVKVGSLADFIASVNGEIRAQNLRLIELQKRQPCYADAKPDPEVELPAVVAVSQEAM